MEYFVLLPGCHIRVLCCKVSYIPDELISTKLIIRAYFVYPGADHAVCMKRLFDCHSLPRALIPLPRCLDTRARTLKLWMKFGGSDVRWQTTT
jgi:hypothetical protein